MTAELKPCPFCGVEASEFKDRGHSTAYSVGCFNGDCTIEPNTWADTKAEAIAAWNTRADLSQAAITAAMMGAVKPLEWVHDKAECEVGVYVIDSGKSGDGRWWAWALNPDASDPFFIWTYGNSAGTEEFAKAAAQADYQARILSALSIPTDAAAALAGRDTQVRDEVLRSAAIAAGNAIVAIAADADPDISPLRKQMLRVKMEKAVKAAFTRDA